MYQPRVPTHLPRLAVVALAALLAIAGLPAGEVRAAEDSDIPGVPLPGPVVTGLLGGPVYERVYWIDVPASTVILLSLRGDPGTDFDLYLFDSSATTVYSEVGLIASSTGPTSTESIAYAARGGGRFYIDLSGFSEQEGEFRLTVTLRGDTIAPSVELRLNGGAAATRDPTVSVQLIASDDLTGVEAMQLSPDGISWHNWQAYAPAIIWAFPPGDGTKRLWARVRDVAGNISSAAEGSIVVDTVSPTIVARDPAPNATVVGLRPTIRITFSEPVEPDSWQNGIVVQTGAGSAVAGRVELTAPGTSGTFVPDAPLQAGEDYIVSVGGVLDLAGNELPSIGSWVFRPLAVRAVSLRAERSVINAGGAVRLIGHVDSAQGGAITLQQSTAGGSWRTVREVVPDASGAFTIVPSPSANTRYRLHIEATETDAEVLGPPVSVNVRRTIALNGPSPSTTRTGTVGRTISVRAIVTPVEPPVVVTITVYRYDSSARTYRAAQTIRRTTVSGIASITWRPTSAGRYYLRLTTPASNQFATGISAAYRWVIQ